MARQISTPGKIQFNNFYPSNTTTTKSHKRVHSSSQHPSEPPLKRPSPMPSPTPTYVYMVIETITPRGQHSHPREEYHGIFAQLQEANSKVSHLRFSGQFSREALRGYRAEIVDGALAWSVPWGGMEFDGVDVRVRKVEVAPQWSLDGLTGDWRTALESLSLVREQEDSVMT